MKRFMGSNITNVMKAMDHTSKCLECEQKLNDIFVHAGIAQNDTRFGLVKLIKHLQRCDSCPKKFLDIASHANCQVQIEKLDSELAKVNM